MASCAYRSSGAQRLALSFHEPDMGSRDGEVFGQQRCLSHACFNKEDMESWDNDR